MRHLTRTKLENYEQRCFIALTITVGPVTGRTEQKRCPLPEPRPPVSSPPIPFRSKSYDHFSAERHSEPMHQDHRHRCPGTCALECYRPLTLNISRMHRT